MSSSVPVVAILNSNEDVVEMLRAALEHAGLICVSTHVDQVKRGDSSLGDFVSEHDPAVVIYDLVPPYDRSWLFLQHIRELPMMAKRKFVITSTNAKRARELSGETSDVLEIIGKPYDINQIVQAVVNASGHAGGPMNVGD